MTGGVLRRMHWQRVVLGAAAGGAASVLALALAAVVEGRGPAQPVNATSHWLNGERAARRRGVDLRHTGVGLATHLAATLFWAAGLEAWRAARPSDDPLLRAAAVSAVAAAVDYTVTPKRFTPGWEFVLTKRSMALAYAAMAAGFAVVED